MLLRFSFLEILVEKIKDRFLSMELVFFFREAVAFVTEDEVFQPPLSFWIAATISSDSALQDAWVVFALQNDEAFGDFIRVKERRSRAQHLDLFRRIADLGVERFAFRFPVGGILCRVRTRVGDAEDIDADGELLGLKGKRSQDHIAAVRVSHAADLLGRDIA
jgi:hypothetical protein